MNSKTTLGSLKPLYDTGYISPEEAMELLKKIPLPEESKPKKSKPEKRNSPTPAPEPEIDNHPSPAVIAKPQNYLILPSHTHGNYSYPDLIVAKTLTPHGNDWYNSHAALHAEGFNMLTLRQFVDFLNLLKSGKAFDGKGQKVSGSKLEQILKEITEQGETWRAEWLDADFKVMQDKLHINYEHRTIKGKLKPQRSESLLPCLAQDKTLGIDLNDYLQRATAQGMPPENVKSGNLYYVMPRRDNNSVARFRADDGLVCFDGRSYPLNSNSAVGVRRARAKNRW